MKTAMLMILAAILIGCSNTPTEPVLNDTVVVYDWFYSLSGVEITDSKLIVWNVNDSLSREHCHFFYLDGRLISAHRDPLGGEKIIRFYRTGSYEFRVTENSPRIFTVIEDFKPYNIEIVEINETNHSIKLRLLR